MVAHPFGRPVSLLTDLPSMIRFVERQLGTLPARRAGVDHYYAAALENRRLMAVANGATIAGDGSRTTFALGGIAAAGAALDDAMRAWLDAAARAVVEGSADSPGGAEPLGSDAPRRTER